MPPPRRASPKKQLTHFLCIPIVNTTSRSQLDAALHQFREQASEIISTKAVRPAGTLHLTLGVMSLTSAQLQLAITRLQELDVQAMLEDTPLEIHLSGLESMHDPENTSTLFVKPHDVSNRLESLCLQIQSKFKDLLVADDRPLKLHVTIVNTIYARGVVGRGAGFKGRNTSLENAPNRSEGHGPRARGSQRFDAREILSKYNDVSWAHVTLDRVAICEMGAEKVYDDSHRLVDEQYKEVAQIALPT